MKKNINEILNFKLLFRFGKKSFDFYLAPFVCLLMTLAIGGIFFSQVNLKPNLGSNFFFASDDPQMQDEQAIQDLFKQDPQVILSIKGNIRAALYYESIKKITEEILDLKDVISAQSLTHGPKNFDDALNGPLWSRVIVAPDRQSTLIPIFVQENVSEVLIHQIEELVSRHTKPDFEILISGAPYIVELLRRSLLKDIKIFSVVAFCFFGGLFLLFFRSWLVLFSTLVTCGMASMLTLIVTQCVGVEMGMLTANLSTITFVLTLSHIIFIIFNWHEIENSTRGNHFSYITEAMLKTLPGSFWSMLTTFLGFLSLLFVKATPLRQLGYAGSLGTVISFLSAYVFFALMFPIAEQGLRSKRSLEENEGIKVFFIKKHPYLFTCLVLGSFLCALGIPKINTDPSLLDYFKKGTELRKGLEYIDNAGGSSPLFIVVNNLNDSSFSDDEGYQKLMNTTKDMEKDSEVGSAVSLPIIIQQAEENFLARLLKMNWLIGILSSKNFGKVAHYFITPDHKQALIMLRMKEGERKSRRVEVMEHLKKIVKLNSLEPVLLGGVYSLQGRMSELVKTSVFSGLSFLLILFVIMAWILSQSVMVSFSVFLSLLVIPLVVLGLLGFLNIPLDIISAPAVNISIGMAVDAMVHMMIYLRKSKTSHKTSAIVWKEALGHYWKPVFYTAVIVGGGFGIFGFSGFPPTQRFGLMVFMGAVMSPCVALIVFPFLARMEIRKAT